MQCHPYSQSQSPEQSFYHNLRQAEKSTKMIASKKRLKNIQNEKQNSALYGYNDDEAPQAYHC